MKAKTFLTSLILLLFVTISYDAKAQVSVNINVNTLPDWAPYEYIPETRYYYIPEIEVYYDIPARMYIYYHRNGWIRSARLPKPYRHFNMFNAYKVSMYDIGPNPYMYFHNHRVKYPKHYHRGHHQPTRVVHVAPPMHRNNGFHNQHAPVRNNRKEREFVNPQNFRSADNNNRSRDKNSNISRDNHRFNSDRQHIQRENRNSHNRGNSMERGESNGRR